MKKIVILGSTGSIGVNALEVVDICKDRFRVIGLTGNTKISLLEDQIKRYHPEIVVAGNDADAAQLRNKCEKKKKSSGWPGWFNSRSNLAWHRYCGFFISRGSGSGADIGSHC